VLIPTCTLLLIVYHAYANPQKKKFFFYLLTVVCGFGVVLWNPETGVISLLTYLAYYTYDTINKYKVSSRAFWLEISKLLITVIGSIIAWLVLLQLITWTRSGALLNFISVFDSIVNFSVEGYYMLPLPKRHPYVLVLGVYSIALVIAVLSSNIIKEKDYCASPDTSVVLALSVIGFGLIGYFMGRSHIYTFVYCIWPVFILLGFFLKILLSSNIKSDGTIVHEKVSTIIIKGTAFLSVCFLFLFVTVSASSIITAKQTEGWSDFSTQRTREFSIINSRRKDLISKYRQPGMAVLDSYSSYYLSELSIPNSYYGTAFIDVFTKQDLEEILYFTENFKGRLFIDLVFIEFHGAVVLNDGRTFAEAFQNILDKHFHIVYEERWLLCVDHNALLLGTVIEDFDSILNASNSFEGILLSGWSGIESWGVWSDANKSSDNAAVLYFSILEERDLSLSINFQTYPDPLFFTVEINGETIGDYSSIEPQPLTLEIREDMLERFYNAYPVEVKLIIENPESPPDDTRLLGIGLLDISITQSD